MDDKLKYYLEIADNAFILSHRISECSSKGPFLEEDLAGTNVALDLIGLAESMYNEAAKIEGKGNTGDDLAYRRSEREYFNCLLTEQQNTDFAYIMTRQFFMDVFNYYFFVELANSSDDFLNAIASKSLKEVTYHVKRSSEWIIRLGGGTEVSNNKTQTAINDLWKYTGELFAASEADEHMRNDNISVSLENVQAKWMQKINEVFYLATLKKPESEYQMMGGKTGIHSEHMGFILTDIQYLTNKYPEATW
ncbi:MAG: phenylacetate-CoA oxygenase subunit PaaC [Crocinitomicaceae bacterium]|nr:phenylacetate-CoA oxygenase subunit PaaC [Crocinitomicaceae bacterium]